MKRMLKTCIVGGGGFIGKHLVEELIIFGRKVTIVGRNPQSPFGPEIDYRIYDKDNPNFFEILFQDMDEVIDMTYSTIPKASFDDALMDIFGNLAISVRIFDSLALTNVKRVIYISSGGAVYGHSTNMPISETHPTNPVSPYGITKLAIEKYGLMYHKTKGLPLIIVRPANAYGPGQRPYSGQGFIATAIASIIDKKPVEVYGKDGTIRDYIFIDDVVDGIISILANGKPGECYNLGTGIGKSNIDILNSLEPFLPDLQREIFIKYCPARSFDVKTNILDSSKVFSDCGWKPTRSYDQGIFQTIDSFK